ncbi:MAG: alkaline phosphatase family protein [Odoribacter sp.]|nr:alkaline phosphatase family protein [Odoribacter sp.]
MVAEVAENLIIGEKLGIDNDPDLLCISFSCLDYMNREFGVEAKEFEDVLLRLDRNIEKLFSVLDSKVGKGNYTLFLTFSESRELLPEELNRMRIKGGYFSIFKAIALLKSYLNLTYGAGDWITDFDAGQIYLNRELIEKTSCL